MMKKRVLMLMAAGMLAAVFCAPVSAQVYTPVDLNESTFNQDIRTELSRGDLYAPLFGSTPQVHVFNDVPFRFEANTGGKTSYLMGDVDIDVDVYGVQSVYTLINSRYGTLNAINGYMAFYGSEGAEYSVNLKQGINIRDHYQGGYNNTIDGTTTVEAFSSSPVRLDMQRFDLPEAFSNQFLDKVTFYGVDNGGQPFLSAVTTSVAPEPVSTVLFLAGGGVFGLAGLRRKQRAARAE